MGVIRMRVLDANDLAGARQARADDQSPRSWPPRHDCALSRKALQPRLVGQLRTGRLMRQANQAKASTTPPRIKNMILIADRPFTADDGTSPGNWEGDL
jgi:hypothetical protein